MIKRLPRIVAGCAVLVSLGALFASCAGPLPPRVPLSAQAKSSIRSVSIKNVVAMPTDSRAWGPSALREVTSDFGEIVRADFEDQLKKASIFPSVVTEGADAEFTLAIGNMSLQMATGPCGGLFTHCYTPVMIVFGVLRGRDGAVLWRKMEQVTILERKVPKRALSEYEDQRDLIRQDLATATQIAVGGLVKDLGEQHP